MWESRVFRVLAGGVIFWFFGLPLLGVTLFVAPGAFLAGQGLVWALAVLAVGALLVNGLAGWGAFGPIPRLGSGPSGRFCPSCGRRMGGAGCCVLSGEEE